MAGSQKPGTQPGMRPFILERIRVGSAKREVAQPMLKTKSLYCSILLMLSLLSFTGFSGCKHNGATRKPPRARGKNKTAMGGDHEHHQGRGSQNDKTSDGGSSHAYSDSKQDKSRPKGALYKWSVAYKKRIRALHEPIEECSKESPNDPSRPYLCMCKLICSSQFPTPPGHGIITVKYPLNGVSGFRIRIDGKGKVLSCSYSQIGKGHVEIDMMCPGRKRTIKRIKRKSRKP